MKYNKLIRDKIPEMLDEKKIPYKIHSADDTEYWEKLKEKLVEEVAEFNKDENIEELADVMEVLDAIIAFRQYSQMDIQKAKIEKAEKRGAFTKKIILEES